MSVFIIMDVDTVGPAKTMTRASIIVHPLLKAVNKLGKKHLESTNLHQIVNVSVALHG